MRQDGSTRQTKEVLIVEQYSMSFRKCKPKSSFEDFDLQMCIVNLDP